MIGAERDAVDVPTRVRVPVAVPIVVPAAVAAVVVVTGSAIAESPAVVRGGVNAVLVAVRVSSVSEGRTDEEARGAVRSHVAETHASEECRLRLGAPEPESRRRRHRQCCPRLGTHAVLLRKVPRPGMHGPCQACPGVLSTIITALYRRSWTSIRSRRDVPRQGQSEGPFGHFALVARGLLDPPRERPPCSAGPIVRHLQSPADRSLRRHRRGP